MPALEQPIPIIAERDKVRVKLPKLQIEKFIGVPKQYRAFRDVFEMLPYWGCIKITSMVSPNNR